MQLGSELESPVNGVEVGGTPVSSLVKGETGMWKMVEMVMKKRDDSGS